MHLNRTTGSAAMGYATVSIDGATPAALVGQGAGNPDGPYWISSTAIAYQNFQTAPGIVEQYDTGTLARTTLTANPANVVCAGGGIWAALLKSNPSIVRSNVSGITGPISGAALGDVSNAGEVAIIGTYPANVGLTVYSASGATLLSLPTVTVIPMAGTGVLRIRDHLLVYLDKTDGWTMANVIGGSFSYCPRINEPIFWTVPVTTASGTTFVVEVSDRITVRYANKPNGWQIQPLGTLAFNPDLIEFSSGVLRIGWSANAGESADALRLMDLTVATGANRVGTVSAGAIVWATGTPLTPTTFEVGPLQGSNAGGSNYIPVQQQPIADKTGLVTQPWRRYFQDMTTGQASNTTAIAAIPPPVLPAPGFGVVTTPNGSPVPATTPNDTLALTSTDATIAITGITGTKTVNLSAATNANDPLPDIFLLMGAGAKKTVVSDDLHLFLLMGG